MVGDSSSIALMTNDKLTWRELNMSLAQRMVQWERGFYQQGRQEGQTLLLQKLLTTRFGDLSTTTRKRLDKATPEQLQHWATRVLTTKNLTEVFRAEG